MSARVHPIVAFVAGGLWAMLLDRSRAPFPTYTVRTPTMDEGDVKPEVVLEFNKGQTIVRVSVELVKDTFGVGDP